MMPSNNSIQLASNRTPLEVSHDLYHELTLLDANSAQGATSDFVETVVGECIRVAYHNLAPYSNEGRVHVNALRSWTYRKTRSVLPGAWGDQDDAFSRTLSEGPGPSLEFLGDLVRLPGGYFTAGPSRGVRINATKVVVVSSWPTRVLTSKGIEVTVRGVSRQAHLTHEDAIRVGLAEQSPGSYAGTLGYGSPREFLGRYIEGRMAYATPWSTANEWEAYTGNDLTRYDFVWGSHPSTWQAERGRVSLWRSSPEFGQRHYRLTIANGSDIVSIHVNPQDSKSIAMALDAVVGRPRKLFVERREETTLLKINFSPPANLYRWLSASGAQWAGVIGPFITWSIQTADVVGITEPIKAMGVTVVGVTR